MSLGAYNLEQDYSHYTASQSNVVLAIVGTATKGPIDTPTVSTGIRDFINKFGPVDTNSYGIYAGQYFLDQASKIYYTRVATSSASHATADITTLTVASATYAQVEIDKHGDSSAALVLESRVIGNDYNDYEVKISESTEESFTLSIYDPEGVMIEKFVSLTVESVKTLNSIHFKFKSIVPGTTQLKDGTYTATGGTGESGTTLEMKSKTKGTFYNGLKIVITDSDLEAKTFTISIVDKNGTLLSNKKNVFVGDLSSYKDDNFQFEEVDLGEGEILIAAKNGIYEVSGGNDGSESVDSSTIITSLSSLSSSNYDYTLLAVPGVSDASVIHRGLDMLEERGDGLMIIDSPYGLTPQGVVDWHNGEGSYSHIKFNSTYGALYYDWQKIYDAVNDTYVDVPPSVVVPAVFARSARISEIWYAPAGLTRGLIRGVVSPVTSPDAKERNYLYLDNNVNPLINDSQAGLCVYGQKTLSRSNTSLNRVNVRLLMNYVKRAVVNSCQYLTFEPNDRITWATFEDLIEPVLESIRNRRGVYEYYIVPGEDLITDDDIDNYRMPGKILIKPTKTAEILPIYFTLTSTGAVFNEVLEATNSL